MDFSPMACHFCFFCRENMGGMRGMFTLTMKNGMAKICDYKGDVVYWENYASLSKRAEVRIPSRKLLTEYYRNWLRVNIGDVAAETMTVIT